MAEYTGEVVPLKEYTGDVIPLKESPKQSALQAITDPINRGLIAGTLGFPVDVLSQALGLVGYKEKEPVGGSEWIGRQMERAGLVSPVRSPIAEMAAGLLPVAPTAAVKGAQAAQKAIQYAGTARGKKAEELSKALQTRMGATAEEIAARAEEAGREPSKKLEAIGEAQRQLGAREPVAAAREAKREQKVNDALTSLSDKKNVLSEDVGAVIQPSALKNISTLRQERSTEAIQKIKEPAFERAENRQASGDFISTNPESAQKYSDVIAKINEQIAKTPEPFQSQLKTRLASLQGKEVPLSQAEQRAAELRASVTGEIAPTTKTEPITLEQAEFMRRYLNEADWEKEGFKALDAQRMRQLGKELFDAMKAYEPGIGKYVEEYQKRSAPLTRALAGRGKALSEVELKEAENVLFSADKKAATNYYLDGSQERAQALIYAVGGKKPEIVNAIKGYFRTELEGMNAKQAASFVQKNEGLLREFPELRKPMEDIVRAKVDFETLGPAAEKKAGAATTRLAGEEKAATTALEKQKNIADKYRIFESKISSLTPKDSISEASRFIDTLRKDKLIDDNKYRQLINEIEGIKTKYAESAQAKQNIQTALRKLLLYSGYGTGGVLGYYGIKALGD